MPVIGRPATLPTTLDRDTLQVLCPRTLDKTPKSPPKNPKGDLLYKHLRVGRVGLLVCESTWQMQARKAPAAKYTH
jgi:hypothetical protein